MITFRYRLLHFYEMNLSLMRNVHCQFTFCRIFNCVIVAENKNMCRYICTCSCTLCRTIALNSAFRLKQFYFHRVFVFALTTAYFRCILFGHARSELMNLVQKCCILFGTRKAQSCLELLCLDTFRALTFQPSIFFFLNLTLPTIIQIKFKV